MEMQTRENSTQELKNENVEKEERILTKRDVTKSWWLWWLSERLQTLLRDCRLWHVVFL